MITFSYMRGREQLKVIAAVGTCINKYIYIILLMLSYRGKYVLIILSYTRVTERQVCALYIILIVLQ